jgi:hypothetical protein
MQMILNMNPKEERPSGRPRSRWERYHTEGRNLRRRGRFWRKERGRKALLLQDSHKVEMLKEGGAGYVTDSKPSMMHF